MDEGGELWKRAGCLVSAAEVPLPFEDDVELAVEGSGLAGFSWDGSSIGEMEIGALVSEVFRDGSTEVMSRSTSVGSIAFEISPSPSAMLSAADRFSLVLKPVREARFLDR